MLTNPTTVALPAAPPLVARYQAAASAIGIAVAALGATALIGWASGLQRTQLPDGGPLVKPNAAAAFVLEGLSLLLLRRRALSVALACAAAGLGAATLAEWTLGVDLRIDELLFRDDSLAQVRPGRMAPNAAAAFALLGGALLLASGGRRLSIARALATGALAIGAVACAGYLYGVSPLSSAARQTRMALPTAVGLVALGAGVLVARPEASAGGLLASDGPGGALARWLLPIAALVPLALALPAQAGVRAGLFDQAYASALVTAGLTAVLAGVVVLTARTVESRDQARREASARLAAHEADLRQLFENMTSGFAHCRMVFEGDRGVDWVYLDVNLAFERIAGLGRAELVGRRASEALPAVDRSRLAPLYGRVSRTGEPARIDEYVERLGRWYTVRAYSPAPEHFAAVFDDVTETRRREQEIEHLNGQLERRAAELSAANRELEAFSYSVSHDLRSPLRSIDGFGQALVEDCAAALPPAGLEHVRRIRAATQRMGQLIDDLLQLARVARSDLRREPVDLSRAAREIAAELARSAPERRVSFEIAEGLVAESDPSLARVLLENLLGNAWKFTSKHASARIAVGRAERGGCPAFFVRDDGAGFDMAHAGKLFGAFQRLHGSAEFAGTGIGLATVQRIVRRHGGEIWAEGAVEEGATFTFTLRWR